MNVSTFCSNSALRMLALAAALVVAVSSPALAANYVVDSLSDGPPTTDGVVTLREALTAASTNVASGDAIAGDADGDTISFSASAIPAGGTITLSEGEIAIGDDVAIDGTAGTGMITVDGNMAGRIFSIDTAGSAGSNHDVSLTNIKLTHGVAARGGAILHSSGLLTLKAVQATYNEATGDAATDGGGALYSVADSVVITKNNNVESSLTYNVADGVSGSGGGIFVLAGSLSMPTHTLVDHNAANRAGGGIEIVDGTIQTVGTYVRNNGVAGLAGTPNPGNGGGVHVSGTAVLNLYNSIISGNTAANQGGGVWNDALSTVTIKSTQVTTNTALGDGGGGIFNDGGTVIITADPGPTTVASNVASGALGQGGGILSVGGSVTLGSVGNQTSNVLNNQATRAGGGIAITAGTLDIDDIDLGKSAQGNQAIGGAGGPGDGGGIYASGSAQVTLTNTRVGNNVAAHFGGGVYLDGNAAALSLTDATSVTSNSALSGGGIFNNGAVLTFDGSVSSVLVSANNVDAAGSGGGIYCNAGELSGNDAVIDTNQMQGIFADNGAKLSLTNVTANDVGNGLETDGAGAVTIDSSSFSGIVARATESVITKGTVSSSAPVDLQTTGDIKVQSGGLSGAASLVIAPGNLATFALGTNSTYTGTTSLVSGTTLIDGSLDSGGGTVSVGSTATLGGSGSISRDVAINGVLNPGTAPSSPGILNVLGNVAFNAGSIFHVDLGGTTAGSQYDQLVVGGAGSVTIDSAATLGGAATVGYAPGDTLLVLNNQAPGTITGSFANATAPASSVILGAEAFNFTYSGGDGNDFVLGWLPSADLRVTNSDYVVSAIPGQSVTYSITASNVGVSAAPGSAVNDTFPAQCTSVSWTCGGTGGGLCVAPNGNGNISDSVNLPIGASVTYTAQCAIDASANSNLVNTAIVTTPSGVVDLNPGDNTAIDTDTLAIAADVAVTLTDNRDFAQVGDSIDYVIEVTNPSGPSTAVVAVSDILPEVLMSGSWTCTSSGAASCGSANGSGNALSDTATIPIGDKVSYLYSATLFANDSNDQVSNTVTASLNNGTDSTPGNNSSTDTDVVVIFRDGFEGVGTSIVKPVGDTSGRVLAQLRVDANLLRSLSIVPVDIASGRSADGKTLFRLQLARFGNAYELRVLSRDDLGLVKRSTWHSLDASRRLVTLAWQSSSDQTADGYLRVDATAPLLVASRHEHARLTQLLIRVENAVAWLGVVLN